MSNKTIGNLVSYPIPISEVAQILDEDVSLARQYSEGKKILSNGETRDVIEGEEGYGNNAKYYAENASELIRGADELIASIDSKIDNAYVEDGYLVLTANGVEVTRVSGIGGGGGGGGTQGIDFKATNTTSWGTTKTFSKSSSCILSFNWHSLENQQSTGKGTVILRVNNIAKLTRSIDQGDVSLNISEYLSTGANVVRLSISDAYGSNRVINFNISVIDLILTSTFNDSIPYNDTVIFPYTPNANLTKQVHFILDGVEVATDTVNTNGWQETHQFSNLTHGAHLLDVYFTANLEEGETVEVLTSNHLYYSIIFVESGNLTPIVSCAFNQSTLNQYDNALIKYVVYTPNLLESEVALYVDNNQVNTVTVDRSRQTWSYRGDTIGQHTLKIESGNVYREFSLRVLKSEITINPVTDSLSLYLTAYGRYNTESNPATWTYGNIEAQFEGFNWSSDGWVTNDEGVQVLRLQSNARVFIPFYPFENDARVLGKTIELEFATSNVMDYNTILISCLDEEDRGFRVTAQEAYMKSEQTSIGTQFKEDEHVRISFVVSKSSNEKVIYCYINGVISGAIRYADDDDFQQTTPMGISIGSSFCTIDIHTIRIYDTDLNHKQIINNWIADMQDGSKIISKYIENDIYDEYGNIVINKLPKYLPYLILEGPELPTYKGDKKNISGQYVNPMDSSRDFSFVNAQIDVQGTSSQYYPRKNFKLKFKNGLTMTDSKEVVDVYALTSDSIPVNTFCFKADYASSEGANNVELVKYYNDLCPYKTPPQLEDPRVRQGIDGYPIVIFWNHSDGNGGTITEFVGKYNFNNDKGTEDTFGFSEGDQSWETLNNTSAKVLWKDDNYATYADWKDDYEARYPDVKDKADPSDLAALASWIKSTDTTNIIAVVEGERVDTGVPVWADRSRDVVDPVTGDITYHGSLFTESITIDEVDYTEDNEEYRLAKFKSEFEDHFDLESTTFYYVFTEAFLMVDSRAKNAFPTKFNGKTWSWLPYDMDTAIGINNEGKLAFTYSLEDIDLVDGAYVFNGQNSALWVNFRKCFFDDIKAMYKDLRTVSEHRDDILSYDSIERRFENHQSKWSASIFNEDSYYKYINPLIQDGTDNLEMCLGSKEEQRKWWLFNRFRYLDSKYSTGDSASSYINFRAYQAGEFEVTPYADIYVRVKCGSYETQVRGKKGIPSRLNIEIYDANDTETMIYSADQIKDAGNLYTFRPGFCNIAMATKLQSLKIGGNARNTYFTSLTLGNNVLLKMIDVRNCPNLKTSIDASKCISLEEAYFEGTSITALSLPDGGIVNTVHLPATITNLTIKNQPYLADLQLAGYNKITTLVIENPSEAVQEVMMDILYQMRNGSRVRLTGLELAFDGGSDIEGFLKKLSKLRGIDANGNNTNIPQLGGTCYIAQATPAQVATLQSYGMTVTYGEFVMYVYFYTEDGSELLDTQATATGIVYYQGLPQVKAADAQYSYVFSGWSLTSGGPAEPGILQNINDTCNLYAAFNGSIRSYTIRFYNGTELLTGYYLPYGELPVYTGATPTYNGDEPDDYDEFIGWIPNINNVTGPQDYQANYRFIGLLTRKYIDQKLVSFESDNVTKLVDGAFYSQGKLSSVTLPYVTEAGVEVFYKCTKLSELNLPNLKSITRTKNNSSSYFIYSNSLKYFDLSNLEYSHETLIYMSSPSSNTFNTLYLPKLKWISGQLCLNHRYLESIDCPSLYYIEGLGSGLTNLRSINIPNLLVTTGSILPSSGDNFTELVLDKLMYCNGAIGLSSKISIVDLGENVAKFPNSFNFSNSMFWGMEYLTRVILRSRSLIKLKVAPNNSNYGDFYNTPFAGNQRYANPEGIYVPHYLVDDYKNATNWSMLSQYIKPIYDVSSITDLSITANDVSGRFSTTTIHVHLEGYGEYLGQEIEDLIILDYDVRSSDFGVNTESSPRTIEVSYTYNEETVTTNITQTGISNDTLVIDNVIKPSFTLRTKNNYQININNIELPTGEWVISEEILEGYKLLESTTYSNYSSKLSQAQKDLITYISSGTRLYVFDTTYPMNIKFINCYGSIDKMSDWRYTIVGKSSSKYPNPTYTIDEALDAISLATIFYPDSYGYERLAQVSSGYDEYNISKFSSTNLSGAPYLNHLLLVDWVRVDQINENSLKKSFVAVNPKYNIEYREVDTRNA